MPHSGHDILSATGFKAWGAADMHADTLARLREHAFETRDPKAAGPPPQVRVGTFVKVGVRGERFWCRVCHALVDGALVGVVDNDLVNSPWRVGDQIAFQRIHVLETAELRDKLQFWTLWAQLGNADRAALAWRGSRAADGTGVTPLKNTRFVLPSHSHY